MQLAHSDTPFSKKLLALDAMGVLYAEADDGLNLLYPFIVEKGGTSDIREIVRLYNEASLGRISSAQFWCSAGVDPGMEDEYLERHRLTDGLIDFLIEMNRRGVQLWCLSNDVSEWSGKLRRKFDLESYFCGFVVSGDAGARKPDPAIYRSLLDKSAHASSDVIFADDRLRNIEAADALGIRGILFNPAPAESQGHPYPIVRTFSELQTFLRSDPHD